LTPGSAKRRRPILVIACTWTQSTPTFSGNFARETSAARLPIYLRFLKHQPCQIRKRCRLLSLERSNLRGYVIFTRQSKRLCSCATSFAQLPVAKIHRASPCISSCTLASESSACDLAHMQMRPRSPRINRPHHTLWMRLNLFSEWIHGLCNYQFLYQRPAVRPRLSDRLHSPQEGRARLRGAAQLYVDPAGCIDCGACVPVCTSDSIYSIEDLPGELQKFVEVNATYYAG
jgi:NAD-dependent dihydropyrimidine dehydrogenase PreA subunit